MKTLKEFKESFKLGTKMEFRSHWTNGETVIRIVKHVQSNSIAMTHPYKDGHSWLSWPKAKEVIFTDHGTYIVSIEERSYFLECLGKGPVFKSVIPYLFYKVI